MMTATLASDIRKKSARNSWLDRPLSNRWCALGWLLATAAFVGLTQLLGGPTQVDATLSGPSTLAIAHAVPACAYPSSGAPGVAPLYPLVSGVLAWMLRVGHGLPFPSSTALGAHCSTASGAIGSWASRSNALSETVLLGYLGWLVLLAGVVALFRSMGRGRCGWEVTGVVLLGCAPPICLVLQEYFHPEDLMAIGLAFAGLACARCGQWIWAGILLGLAITSQQFALLVAAPILVVAPRNQRIRYAAAMVGSAAVVVVGMLVITSGRVIDVLTGATATSPNGGTFLHVADLHGFSLLVAGRVLPIAFAMVLGWWSERRLGAAALDPVPLVSLIATSLCFRLVFEVNIFGYYFMAVSASLIVLNVIRGRIHLYLVAWLVLVTFAYDPLRWGSHPWTYVVPMASYQLLLVPAAVALAVTPLISVVRGRNRSVRTQAVRITEWSVGVGPPIGQDVRDPDEMSIAKASAGMVGDILIRVAPAANMPPWAVEPMRRMLPIWFWEIVILPTGIALAAGPFISQSRHSGLPNLDPATRSLAMVSVSDGEGRED